MSAEAGSSLVVDTHSVIWYLQMDPRLSRTAELKMDVALAAGHVIHVPSICLVEMIYLVEKKRIPSVAFDRVDEVIRNPGSGFQLAALDLDVTEAIPRIARNDVPDMPDRIIAATAVALGLPLITRDGKIRGANIQTIW